MQDLNELANAFGQADSGFVNNVYNTLARLEREQRRKSVTMMYFRIAAVIMIFCILSVGTVLAVTNTWGILDFLSGRRTGVEVLPEASEIVQTEVPQEGTETDLAVFTVREAVYDGQSVFVVLDVKPLSPEYLLLGPDVYPSDYITDLGPVFSEKTGTIADYAEENHKVMLQTSIVINGADCSTDYLLSEDGTLVYMINGILIGSSETTELELGCVAVPFILQDGKYTRDFGNKKETVLTATLKNNGTKETLTSTEPVVFYEFGVRVEKITLSNSAVSTYAEIEYTVIDTEKYAKTDGGIWFDFLDNDGECIPGGAASGGGIESVDEKHYIEKLSLQAMEKLPDEVILCCRDFGDKNQSEIHTIKMK